MSSKKRKMLFEDAYGDLGAAAESAAAGRQTLEERLEEANRKVEGLQNEVKELRTEKRVWAKQRAVLLHNLGGLLKTARLEIGRKEREIERLRKEGEQRKTGATVGR